MIISQLGNAVYGLRNIRITPASENNSAPALLEALTEKLSLVESFDGITLSRLVYGINEMSSSHLSVREYLLVLTDKIPSLQGNLDAQGVGEITISVCHPMISPLFMQGILCMG